MCVLTMNLIIVSIIKRNFKRNIRFRGNHGRKPHCGILGKQKLMRETLYLNGRIARGILTDVPKKYIMLTLREKLVPTQRQRNPDLTSEKKNKKKQKTVLNKKRIQPTV